MNGLTLARTLAERLYAALAAGDAAALGELLDDDFEGFATEGLPLGIGGAHHGAAAMRDDFWWTIGRHYQAEACPDEFAELADGRLLVRGRYKGRGRRSGMPLDAAFMHLITLRDGRICALEQLTDSVPWVSAIAPDDTLQRFRYRVENGVAHVVLSRPEKRNAIDQQVADETLQIARMLESDTRVRAVLIYGEGSTLTVGGDIDHFALHADGDMGALFGRMIEPFQEAFRLLSNLDAPIVTAAQGAVAGGGLGFVYAADIVIASEDARFVTAFADLGVSGDGGGTWHLPKLIGPARAARVLLENRPISAQEAVEWGLISEVVPRDSLLESARGLAERLAVGPTRALGVTRRLLRDSWSQSLSAQLSAELDVMFELGRSRDAVNAVNAFLRKDRPTFEGN